MSTPSNIEAHIRKIRNGLWKYRPRGRAAVMVGAGFSFNANHLGTNSQKMVTWNQLKNKMLDGLDLSKSFEHIHRWALFNLLIPYGLFTINFLATFTNPGFIIQDQRNLTLYGFMAFILHS